MFCGIPSQNLEQIRFDQRDEKYKKSELVGWMEWSQHLFNVIFADYFLRFTSDKECQWNLNLRVAIAKQSQVGNIHWNKFVNINSERTTLN